MLIIVAWHGLALVTALCGLVLTYERGPSSCTRVSAAPKVILYDFACALSAYCWNRDPAFFRDTLFLVDRLHDKNHSCAKSFAIETTTLFKEVNTQANEQYNSDLQRLHSQLSYMSPQNFVLHLRLYLYLRNVSKPACAATTVRA